MTTSKPQNGKVITAPPQANQADDVLALLQNGEIKALLQDDFDDWLALQEVATQLIALGHIEDVWWITRNLYHWLGVNIPKEAQARFDQIYEVSLLKSMNQVGSACGPLCNSRKTRRKSMSNKVKPKAEANEWFHDGLWRRLYEWDNKIARSVRQALCQLGFYPMPLFKGHSRGDEMEANYRALLRQLADELSSDDVVALAKAGRLLALVEREKDPVE